MDLSETRIRRAIAEAEMDAETAQRDGCYTQASELRQRADRLREELRQAERQVQY